MNIKATTRQAIAPEIQISMPYRRGDDNTVHMTLNILGTSNRYAANIIADLITRTVTLTDYSQKTIDGSVSFLTPVELAPTVRAQLESSIAAMICWDDHPVVPAYSITYSRSGVARVTTDDFDYLVDFDGVDLDATCLRITYTDTGEIEEEIKTPDWMHYSVSVALYSDAA